MCAAHKPLLHVTDCLPVYDFPRIALISGQIESKKEIMAGV